MHDKAQKLIKFFDLVGKSQQETAEFLIELLDFGNKTLEMLANEVPNALKTILDDFAKVENEKRFDIEQSWQRFLSEISTNRDDLVLRLTHDNATRLAKSIGELLNSESVNANDLTWNLINKSFEHCNDGDIGQCQMCLQMLVDYQPPRPAPPPILPPPPIPNESIIEILRRQIESLSVSKNDIRQALQQLLNDYRD